MPDEVFQTECMTELLSELDSSDVPEPRDQEEENEESVPALRLTCEEQLTATKEHHTGRLAMKVNLPVIDRTTKIWEERTPGFRSERVSK